MTKGQIGLEGHTEAILCQPVRIFLSQRGTVWVTQVSLGFWESSIAASVRNAAIPKAENPGDDAAELPVDPEIHTSNQMLWGVSPPVQL